MILNGVGPAYATKNGVASPVSENKKKSSWSSYATKNGVFTPASENNN